MSVVTSTVRAAVVPTAGATRRLHPLDAGAITIRGGFWADRLRINRDRTIPHGFEQLVRVGNLTNLRLAAGETGHYQALGERLPAIRQSTSAVPWPYTDDRLISAEDAPGQAPAAIEIRAIPYFAWANRGGGAMRVWIPTAERDHEVADDGPR